MKTIDLGREEPDWSKSVPSPVSETKEEDLPKRTVYPSLYIDGAPKGLGEIPEEGVALVRYRIRSKTVNTRERDGERKTDASAEIEIMNFKPQPAKAEKIERENVAKEKSTDDAFDSFFG